MEKSAADQLKRSDTVSAPRFPTAFGGRGRSDGFTAPEDRHHLGFTGSGWTRGNCRFSVSRHSACAVKTGQSAQVNPAEVFDITRNRRHQERFRTGGRILNGGSGVGSKVWSGVVRALFDKGWQKGPVGNEVGTAQRSWPRYRFERLGEGVTALSPASWSSLARFFRRPGQNSPLHTDHGESKLVPIETSVRDP